MKRWREEKGSALVMVMFMMLILTLLGVTILSATVAGSRRTLTRENDIQSLQLTQKVLDESVAYISKQLNTKVEQPSFDAKNLKMEIENIVNALPVDPEGKPKADGVQTSDLYAASGSLTSHPKVEDDFPIDDPLKVGTAYKFKLTAVGTVNGVKRTLTQEVKVNMYPDFLQYAFGSEQNLILNGAPYINGNIYAGKDLIVTNRPKYVYKGSSLATNSVFPQMEKTGQVFIQSLDQFATGENDTQPTPITSEGDAAVGTRVKQALNIDVSQIHIKNQQKFVQINVENSFLEKLATSVNRTGVTPASLQEKYQGLAGPASSRASAIVSDLETDGVRTVKMPDEPKLETIEPLGANPTDVEIQSYNEAVERNQKKVNKYNDELNTLKTDLASLKQTTIYKGDLLVDGQTFNSLAASSKGYWLIVNGNLTVAGGSQPITLASNVLVTGDVRFKDHASVDSTLLTMGRTTIEDATITGIQSGSDQKEIVLISKGEVLLNRVDAFQDTVSSLRGFFYTDSTATLYGVGSNFSLEGGFFAKGDLTVNAVVGRATAGDTDIAFEPPSAVNQDTRSRFKVRYNDEVYAHQGSGLPQVQHISINAGKLQLD
ncbi:hypothetical protein B9G55_10230 [Saccharibacillus sp. O16]|nr:hypothetical protein B9G55_10230 [Saccharibacillus sp. O16]